MITILHEPEDEAAAVEVASTLKAGYGDKLKLLLLPSTTVTVWPSEYSWDDMLVVLFSEKPLNQRAKEFLEKEGSRVGCIPIGLSPSNRIPPEPISGIKALFWHSDIALAKERLTRRLGALLGLRLRSPDHRIFISYRAADGTAIAEQLEQYLKDHGYRVWRDESKDDFDQEGNILPGQDVQQAIEANLQRADLLVLLDTPHAADSHWIKLEVDLANGRLIPVLPLLFLGKGERRKTSRFYSLATLQRGCEFSSDNGVISQLREDQLLIALNEMESYLCEIFQRKLRVPFLVEKEFTSRGYDWSDRDNFIYEAIRQHQGTLRTRVFSHCSYFEGIFDPALLAFVQHLDSVRPRANYALYVYDGLLISSEQIEEIRRKVRIEETTDIIILHHQEIATLLHNNFTTLRA